MLSLIGACFGECDFSTKDSQSDLLYAFCLVKGIVFTSGATKPMLSHPRQLHGHRSGGISLAGSRDPAAWFGSH